MERVDTKMATVCVVEGHLRDMTAESAERVVNDLRRVLKDSRYTDRIKLFIIAKALQHMEVDE